MPSALDDSTERVRKHRQAVKERGGAVIGGVTLAPSPEATTWKRLVFEQGGPKAAIVYLLRREMGRADDRLSNEDLGRLVAARLATAAEPEPIRPETKSSGKTPKKSG